jgi:GTP cyclohydrolase I
VQEHLTRRIVDSLDRVLRPQAALVVLEAEHTCMTLRGVRKEGSRFLTWAAAGAWKDDPGARREILDRLTP